MNGVTVLAKACENGVTGLVIRGAALVGFGDDAALFLRPHKDFIDTVVKLDVSDELFAVSGGENRGFVQKIGEIRAGEAGSDARHGLEVDVGSHGLVARMDLENLFASLDVGQINVNLTVETARTKQSRVENIRAVSCGHDDDALVRFKAVHLNEDLIEGLFALVVSAAEPRAAPAAHGVDFVDEDDTGLIFLCEVEEVADSCRADADVHFHEVGTGYGEEGNARFACDGLCEQRLTGTRRADEQYAARNSRAEVGKLFGHFQELDDFLQFFLFLFRARDVREAYFEVALNVRLGLADIHDLSAAGRLAHDEPEDDRDEHDAEHGNDAGPNTARIGVFVDNIDAFRNPLLNDGICRVIGVRSDRGIICHSFARRIDQNAFQVIAVRINLIDFSGSHLFIETP